MQRLALLSAEWPAQQGRTHILLLHKSKVLGPLAFNSYFGCRCKVWVKQQQITEKSHPKDYSMTGLGTSQASSAKHSFSSELKEKQTKPRSAVVAATVESSPHNPVTEQAACKIQASTCYPDHLLGLFTSPLKVLWISWIPKLSLWVVLKLQRKKKNNKH